MAAALDAHPDATMVAVVHGETSSGVANIGKLVRERGKILVVDTACSLGGAHVPVDEWMIDICFSRGKSASEGRRESRASPSAHTR